MIHYIRNILTFGVLLVGVLPIFACTDSDEQQSVESESQSTARLGNETVIYEANPRFFAESNCLQAVENRLEDIKEMGTNVLWLMPIYEPGELNSIGSPYCIKDYMSLNPAYGTLDDLKALVDKAHGMDMKVMLDWVANHTSWDHVWINEHPDWYTQDAAGNIISPEGQNWSDVADLNYDNTDMREAMMEAMLYWVNEAGIDGFRCDYTDGVPHDFWTEAIARLRAVRPDLLMLSEGEDEAYWEDGFDMVYGWSYASELARLFQGRITPVNFLENAVSEYATVPEGKSILRYVYNHDVAAENDLNELYGSVDALPAAYVLTAMLEGVPLLYSSMDTDWDGSPLSFFNYSPLQWDADRQKLYASINEVYAATAEVRGGEIRTYADDNAVVFTHTTSQHTLLVMVNVTGEPAEVKVPIAYAGVSMQEMFSGEQLEMPVTVSLDAYEHTLYYK